MAKQRWPDLSSGQQATVIATGVQLALRTAALVDIGRRPADRINGSKGKWITLSFVNFVGPISYFAFGRRRSS